MTANFNEPTGTTQSSAEIERNIDESRTKVADTLRTLRDRMSPGQLVDELIDYTKTSSGAEFTHNLKRSVTQNPLPLLLMGTGVAWLMTSSQQPTSGYSGYSAEGTGSSSGSVADSARGAVDAVGRTASDYSDATQRFASDTKDQVKNAAYQAQHAAQNAAQQAQQTWQQLAEDQPLVIGALGIALGALLGAGLPATSVENRMMGDASDSLKEKTKDEVSHQYESVKETAADTFEKVSSEVGKKGLSTDTVKKAVDDVGSAASKIASEAKSGSERRMAGKTDNSPGAAARGIGSARNNRS